MLDSGPITAQSTLPPPATRETGIDFAKLRSDLERAVARLCPTWLSSARDDVVQAAVMRVMHVTGARPDGEGMAPLGASYLYKVAHSALIDEIRRARRRGETDLDAPGVSAVAVTSDDPERITASRQIGREIVECLSHLNRERRLAVTLYLQGHSVPEAARVLDWPAKRTENLVYRGLANLRACLLRKGLRP